MASISTNRIWDHGQLTVLLALEGDNFVRVDKIAQSTSASNSEAWAKEETDDVGGNETNAETSSSFESRFMERIRRLWSQIGLPGDPREKYSQIGFDSDGIAATICIFLSFHLLLELLQKHRQN